MNYKFVEKAKAHFLKAFENKKNPGYLFLPRHVNEVVRWANKIVDSNPEVNREVVLLSVWFHDIGHVIGKQGVDHAIKSEKEAKRFLSKLGVKQEIIKRVAHCVRSHRCKDIQPETLEAKVLAVADSASHMTDINYIVHCTDGIKKYAVAKLERDYRDIGLFPDLIKEMVPLYRAWKQLLKVFPD